MRNIHIRMRQLRLFQWVVSTFLMILTWAVWEYIEINLKDLKEWQVVVPATAFGTLIAGLFGIAKVAAERQQRDED